MAIESGLFDRELRLASADFTEETINKALAMFAKDSLADVIGSGIAPPTYDRFVNNIPNLPEESVRAPGPIVYVFSNWKLIITQALVELRKRAPRGRTGKYADSFIVIHSGRITTDYSNIPPEAEVIITNFQPYVRKIEVGANKTGRRNFDLSKVALNTRFGAAFRAETKFLNIQSGVHPEIPYILKNSQGRRKGRQAGSPLTYPALVLNPA